METVIKDVIEGGLTPELMMQLFVLVLVIFIALWIRGWIVRQLAFMRFKGSMNVAKDVIVRESTSVGHVDFRFESIDSVSIILRSVDGKLKKVIPTKSSNDRDWVIVQRRDESAGIAHCALFVFQTQTMGCGARGDSRSGGGGVGLSGFHQAC